MVIEETPFDQVKSIKLENGEPVSTLEKYLKAGKKGKTRLILEVKSRYIPELELAVAREAVKQVKKAKVASRTAYITGSTGVTREIARLDPEAKIAHVAFLKTALEPQKLKELGCNGIDYHYSVYQKYPQWIKEAHDLGMKSMYGR
ncbi:MAG: glycerophosphodiester phosphodiesterase [Mangrovibacterium sp.]